MNAIWTNQGLTSLGSLIGSGDEIVISDFILSGAQTKNQLKEFRGNSDTTLASFPDKIYRAEIEESYVSADGFLTVFCKIPEEVTGAFFYNGIGIVLKDEDGNEVLLGLSRLLTEQYCGGNEKNIWFKLPAFIENRKSVFNLNKNHSINLKQLKSAIKSHNQDPASHPFLLDSIESVSEVVKLELYHKIVNAEFELFKKNWTLLKPEIYKYASFDSDNLIIELDTTKNITPGNYVIYSKDKKEEIEIKEVIDLHKIKIKKALNNQFDNTALISKTSIKNYSSGEVTLETGDIYISREINLGKSEKSHSIIIRQSTGHGKLEFFVKEKGQDSFLKNPYKWATKVDETYTDYEYQITANKEFVFKLEAKENDLKIDHIVCIGQKSAQHGIHNPPEKPVNKSPRDLSVSIKETPTLEIVKYAHPLGTAQKSIQFQVSSLADFSVIIHDSGKLPRGTTYSLPGNIIHENTKYYWRARVEDVEGGISEFSEAFSFTTEPDFEYIKTPQNTYPTTGQTAIDETTTLSASGFSVYGTDDTHVKSQWRIRTSNQNWSNPAHDSGETDSLTSYNTPSGILHLGENHYFFQVRYKGTKLGWSEWSQETEFITDAENADAVGVALVKAGGGAGTWQNIDGDGNNINPNKAFWNNHPIYGNIKDVVIDGQAMVKIPKFYYKVETLKSGDQAGKKAWFVSSRAQSGFSLHPAFLYKSKEISHFFVGKYEVCEDPNFKDSKLASLKNKEVKHSLQITEIERRCKARNTGSVNGFHSWNIHELSAIQFLCLIELESPDVQSLISEGDVYVRTGGSSAVWRGIYELWGNFWHCISGIRFNENNNIVMVNSYGVMTNTGQQLTRTSGYINSMNNEFKSYFIPAVTTGHYQNATYSDYIYTNPKEETIFFHGGDKGDRKVIGLYSMAVNSIPTATGSNITGRLAFR